MVNSCQLVPLQFGTTHSNLSGEQNLQVMKNLKTFNQIRCSSTSSNVRFSQVFSGFICSGKLSALV